jgi:uncharacterized protein YcfJ
MVDIISTIIGLISGGFLGGVIVIIYVFKNPEKVEKWGSIIYKFASYVIKKYEKNYMMSDIQSTIEIKRKELGLKNDVLPYGIKIKWTEEESVEVDLQQNKVLVMMKPSESQSKNLAHIRP